MNALEKYAAKRRMIKKLASGMQAYLAQRGTKSPRKSARAPGQTLTSFRKQQFSTFIAPSTTAVSKAVLATPTRG